MANQGEFADGDVLSAADLNAFRQVTILNDTISVANATNVTPTFSTEIIDVGGWHSTGSSDIVVPYDGVYTVIANAVGFSSARGLVNIFIGGAVVASTDLDGAARDISCAITATASASAVVNLQLFQNSGSTQTPVVTFSVELVRRI